MRSRITIQCDFSNNNEPYIEIYSSHTDDLRDKMLKAFLENLGHDSSWLRINCADSGVVNGDSYTIWKVKPIRPSQIQDEANIMRKESTDKSGGFKIGNASPVVNGKENQYVDQMTIRCGPTPIDNRSDRSESGDY